MKEYNRQTKKWEDPVDKAGTLKKKRMCVGGITHDFQLALPDYLYEHQDLPQESIEEYYKSQERVTEFVKKEEELLISLGIKKRMGFKPRIYRYYKCSKCGKKEYNL